jgi:3-deoxy-7-phosphoheptulonate synthase
MSEFPDSRIAGIEPLPTPSQLRQSLPLNSEQKQFIAKSRQTIINILQGKDPRLLLIIGPCSIHDITAAQEYASKLKQITPLISDAFFPVMRAYFEKARSSVGWKGMMYDPHLDGSHEIQEGLVRSRRLLIELIDLKIPTATEFLDPTASNYIHDLICWGSIGARTVSSQIHRQLASSLPIPIGFKNSTDGSIENAINAMISSASPHSHFGMDEQGMPAVIHSMGNPHTHIVLRGGENRPNYSSVHVEEAIHRLKAHKLPTRLMIDCSHDNSYKQHHVQPEVFQDVIAQVAKGQEGIIGFMIESNLLAGSQSFSNDKSKLQYGISLTDGCLDWNVTHELLMDANSAIQNKISAKLNLSRYHS